MLPLSQALSSTSFYSRDHHWPFLNVTTRKAYLDHLPSPTHFPMHCQGDLSKSKFDSITPFLIIFHELQITYSWGPQPQGYRPSFALLPEFCLPVRSAATLDSQRSMNPIVVNCACEGSRLHSYENHPNYHPPPHP